MTATRRSSIRWRGPPRARNDAATSLLDYLGDARRAGAFEAQGFTVLD